MPVAFAAADVSLAPALLVVASGEVTFREARDFQIALLADERLRGGIRMLCDARTVYGAPSVSELKVIAREMAPLASAGLGPVAIVCSSPFIYGVARMFATLAEPAHARVAAFREMDEALDWLDRQVAA